MAQRLKQNFNEVQAILDAVGQKVDKIEGKGLSANDYTDQDKDKLASVEEDAQENVIEAIESDGVELPIENKTVIIPAHKQSDWSQNDSSGKDYIKNRTHWEENGVVHKLHPKFLDMDASPTSGSTKPVTSSGVKEALDGKQDVIRDLADIRQGAGLGETAYQKPSAGIPASDLAAGVVVNNLLDGGTTEALSAEQGKTLNIHDYVAVDIDPDDWHVYSYYLNVNTGKWGSSTDYKHLEIPVHGCAKVIVKAPSGHNAEIAWLDTYGNASSGATADITPGSTGTVVPAGTTVEVTAPTEAHYMYVYLGTLSDDEYTFAPESVAVLYDKAGSDYTTGEDEQGLSRGDLIPLVDLIAKGENIDLTSLTRYVGFIGSNGNSTGSGNGDRFYIPVKEGQQVIIKPQAQTSAQFAWVSQIRAENTNNGQSLYMLSGTQRMSTSPDVIWTGTVPAGAAALLVNTGSASYWYGREGMTPKAVYLYNSPSFSDGTGINEVNPESEFRPKMMSARKRYYTSTTNDKQPPLVIAHLSDIHANWPNVSRFLEFTKKYSTFIDELLNTGDTVSDHLSQGIAGYAAIDGAEDILNIIGNHDTRGDGGGNNWRDNIGLPAYNAIIAPFVANWGVTQPEGAAENGYCYFYKDYTAKSIRLVCVDIMAYDSTEDTWLAGVLADALTNGLHVVIATHFAGSTSDNTQPAFTKIPCDYTSLYAVGGTSDQLDVYNPYAYHMMATVDSFMQSGGKFVGYLQGHYHTDVIARVAAYPSQMIYSIGSSKAGETRDFAHTVGTRNQDEFQIIAIDTVNTIVKIFKVGAHIDRYGRVKESVCVNYGTAEVIGVDTTFEALREGMSGKQDTISDLATIRSGAALGATALQSYTEIDPTVPSWAKAQSKPTYTATEVGAQPTLVSGTNIKTINNESLLGSGNITINADTSACELLANKVTSLSSSSTDVQYPSAKATYDAILAVTTESLTTSEIDTIWNNAS